MVSEPGQRDQPSRSQRARSVRVLVSIGGFFITLCVLYLSWGGILLPFQSVRILESLPDDTRPDPRRYFGFFEDQIELKARKIAEVTGSFSLDTKLSASLYVIRSGRLEEIEEIAVGRSSNQIGAPSCESLRIRLALGQARTDGGWIIRLGSYGQSHAGGGVDTLTTEPITATNFRLFPGKLSNGKKYLIYVEGDRPFGADRSMTVEEFAKTNRGNYLVVTGQLN